MREKLFYLLLEPIQTRNGSSVRFMNQARGIELILPSRGRRGGRITEATRMRSFLSFFQTSTLVLGGCVFPFLFLFLFLFLWSSVFCFPSARHLCVCCCCCCVVSAGDEEAQRNGERRRRRRRRRRMKKAKQRERERERVKKRRVLLFTPTPFIHFIQPFLPLALLCALRRQR